jgi:nicotinamidase-related amidase
MDSPFFVKWRFLFEHPDDTYVSYTMTNSSPLDNKTTALLVMDFQREIVENYAADKEILLTKTARLIEASRRQFLKIIYVVVGFRPEYPEVGDQNKSFRAIKAARRLAPGEPGTEIHSSVAPKPGDIVITKHRTSAFAGTDLDMILRANRIETLVLSGIATSGVILSTLRHAADADYKLFVVRDCCSDRDDEIHRVLIEKVFIRQATVVDADEMIEALES